MIAYVFPGQGSQKKGMGAELFDEFPNHTKIADEVLGYSIKELCVEDPEDKLNITEYTQPALYVVSTLCYLKKIKETGRIPDYVLGHSLGEYNALTVAGVFDFRTGLELVKMRGKLMYQAGNGGMAAVLGLSESKVRQIIVDNHLDDIDISNLNTPNQIVIGGPNQSIEAAQSIFEESGAKRYVVLKVSGAFHSRYMTSAAKEFTEFIKRQNFNEPEIQVISNYTARPYQNFEVVENLVKQIDHTVKWVESIEYLMGKGVSQFEQIGVGNVALGMVKAIRRDGEPIVANEEEEIQARKVQIEEDKKRDVEKKSIQIKEFTEEPLQEEDTTWEIPRKDRESRRSLGSKTFMERYDISYAYAAGGMGNGISSVELVEDMSNHNLLSFLGSKNVNIDDLRKDIHKLSLSLGSRNNYGVNCMPTSQEEDIVTLCLENNIRVLECSSYIDVSEQLIRYKAKGIKFSLNGYEVENRILVKLNHPEVLNNFLMPVSTRRLDAMCEKGIISRKEADVLKKIPIADDICLISGTSQDSNQIPMFSLLPVMLKHKENILKQNQYKEPIHMGVAGGIGSPESIKCVMELGADFVMTGTINQASVEAKTSELVKTMLGKAQIQDTAIIPSSDFLNFGEKVQILKKGTFFHARTMKLNHLYNCYDSIEEIKQELRDSLETRYFGKKFEEIQKEIKLDTEEQNNKKVILAKVFQWYYHQGLKKALRGQSEDKADYFIYCSSAMGVFNEAVKGTSLQELENRNVHNIAEWLMKTAEEL